MQQRLELAGHDDVHEKHRQQQRLPQRAGAAVHLLDLAGQPPAGVFGPAHRSEALADVARRPAEPAGGEVGLHHRDPPLADATDVGRPGRDLDVRHRGQRDRDLGAGIDDQLAKLAHGGAVVLAEAHHDVDAPLALAVLGGARALHLRTDQVGDLPEVETESNQRIPVVHDLDLGAALSGRGLDVGQRGDGGQGEPHPLAEVANPFQLVRLDLDLDRRPEREQHRPPDARLSLDHVVLDLSQVRDDLVLPDPGGAAGAGVGERQPEPP